MEEMISPDSLQESVLQNGRYECVKQLESCVVDMMEEACCGVEKLARERSVRKLSNSRIMGVAKEMRDLMKVLSACSY